MNKRMFEIDRSRGYMPGGLLAIVLALPAYGAGIVEIRPVSLGAPSPVLGQPIKMAPSAAFSQLPSLPGGQADLPAAPAIIGQAVRAADAGPALSASRFAIQIPEPNDLTIDPARMRPVKLREFDQAVMPRIMSLQFFSFNKNRWVKMPYHNIYNNCFARRAAVDAFLWFAAPLKAEVTREGTLMQYLLPGFKTPDFKTNAWVETARINVIGQLQPPSGHASWSNHETVVINTDQGVMVVDPAFSAHPLTLQQWFAYFAPGKTCQPADGDLMRSINMQLVRTQNFHQPWDPKVPRCGYAFGQRLDARDMISATANFYGTAEQKFLGAKFYSSLEDDLSQ